MPLLGMLLRLVRPVGRVAQHSARDMNFQIKQPFSVALMSSIFARRYEAEKGQTSNDWFQDLKEWTKLDIAGASQLATDRERWRQIIKVIAAQMAPPD